MVKRKKKFFRRFKTQLTELHSELFFVTDNLSLRYRIDSLLFPTYRIFGVQQAVFSNCVRRNARPTELFTCRLARNKYY